jgi:hypothetical protein
MADRLYLVPVITVNGTHRGPAYFQWRLNAGITSPWAMMDYGLMPTALVHAWELSPADEATLDAAPDVYQFPDVLAQPVADPTLDAFFEGLSIPTNWLTPSTTYRELLRSMAGLFQFAQRFEFISGGLPLFGDGVTLETNYNQTGARQAFLDATLASFGYPSVQGNPKLRALAKQAGDAWDARPFVLGPMEF